MNNIKLHLKNCSYTKKEVYYPYYAIANSVRIEGKNQKKILTYIGSLSDEEAKNLRVLLKLFNEKAKLPESIDDFTIDSVSNSLDIKTLHALWNFCGLNNIFSNSKDHNKCLSTLEVAEILTLAKILNTSSHTDTINWLSNTTLCDLLNIEQDKYNKMKIFNELDNIADAKNNIEEHFIDFCKKCNDNNLQIFFIDGTTTFFEGNTYELSSPAKDKTTGFRDHVILILVVTDINGTPCMWDVHSGKTSEKIAIKSLVERARILGLTNITYCFDRGFVSNSNLSDMQNNNEKFISALNKNQISSFFNVDTFDKTKAKIYEAYENKSNNKKFRVSYPIDGFYSANCEKFYMELGGLPYRHIIGFSIDVADANRKNRNKNIIETSKKINELNSNKNKNENKLLIEIDKILIKNGTKKFVETTIKKENNYFNVELKYKEDEIQKDEQLDGLFMYVTNHTESTKGHYNLSAYNIISHYKNKYVIEDSFNDLKNILKLRPLYVRTPKHVIAAINIAMTALFLTSTLQQKLKNKQLPGLKSFLNIIKNNGRSVKLKNKTKTIIKKESIRPEIEKIIKELNLNISI